MLGRQDSTAVNVPGKKIRVTAAMMRMSVLSRRVRTAIFLVSRASFWAIRL